MCRVVQDVDGFCKSCCLCCIALLLKVLYPSGRFTFFLPACQFPQFWHCEALFIEPLDYVSSCMTPYMRKAAEEECGLWVTFCHTQDLLCCILAEGEDCFFCPAWQLKWHYFECTMSLSMSSSPVSRCAPQGAFETTAQIQPDWRKSPFQGNLPWKYKLLCILSKLIAN